MSAVEDHAFDDYILALSWSPHYCATHNHRPSDAQCAPGASFGFIVHGLWPQKADGPSPQYCVAEPRDVPEEHIARLAPLMPSRSLVEHEWDRHGKCSGVPLDSYVRLIEIARAWIAIPGAMIRPARAERHSLQTLKTAFQEINPGLTPAMFFLVCKKDRLSEVRICLAKDMRFHPCALAARDRCPARVTLLPVR